MLGLGDTTNISVGIYENICDFVRNPKMVSYVIELNWACVTLSSIPR